MIISLSRIIVSELILYLLCFQAGHIWCIQQILPQISRPALSPKPVHTSETASSSTTMMPSCWNVCLSSAKGQLIVHIPHIRGMAVCLDTHKQTNILWRFLPEHLGLQIYSGTLDRARCHFNMTLSSSCSSEMGPVFDKCQYWPGNIRNVNYYWPWQIYVIYSPPDFWSNLWSTDFIHTKYLLLRQWGSVHFVLHDHTAVFQPYTHHRAVGSKSILDFDPVHVSGFVDCSETAVHVLDFFWRTFWPLGLNLRFIWTISSYHQQDGDDSQCQLDFTYFHIVQKWMEEHCVVQVICCETSGMVL